MPLLPFSISMLKNKSVANANSRPSVAFNTLHCAAMLTHTQLFGLKCCCPCCLTQTGEFFSLHMPLLPSTKNLFNEAAFNKIKVIKNMDLGKVHEGVNEKGVVGCLPATHPLQPLQPGCLARAGTLSCICCLPRSAARPKSRTSPAVSQTLFALPFCFAAREQHVGGK